MAGRDASTDVITYTTIKTAIAAAIYGPTFWPTLAVGFHGLLTGNYTAVQELAVLFAQSSSFQIMAQKLILGFVLQIIRYGQIISLTFTP